MSSTKDVTAADLLRIFPGDKKVRIVLIPNKGEKKNG